MTRKPSSKAAKKHPNRIRELRDAAGWTQPQLAERLECSYQEVSRLEIGTRKLTQEWMVKIARALGLADPGELLPRTDPVKNSLEPVKDSVEARLLRLLARIDDPAMKERVFEAIVATVSVAYPKIDSDNVVPAARKSRHR